MTDARARVEASFGKCSCGRLVAFGSRCPCGLTMTNERTRVTQIVNHAIGHRALVSEMVPLVNAILAYGAAQREEADKVFARIMARVLEDSPDDVAPEIASGHTLNDVYVMAKVAIRARREGRGEGELQ